MKKIILSSIICAAFLLAPVMSGNLALAAEKAPADTIAALQNAVDTRNSKDAEKYIDLDRVTGNAVNTLLPIVCKAIESSQLKLEPGVAALLSSVNSGNAAARLMATQFVVAETRKFVLYGVESGSFAGKPVAAPQADGGMFLTLGGIDKHRKEFIKTRTVEESGNKAVVATSIKDYSNGSVYNLLLDMEKHNDTWRVVNIKNAEDLLNLVFH